MMSYLVLPHLRVQGANMYNAAFLVGGPPVLAAWFMAHALGRKMGLADDVRSLAFVLHSYTPLGDYFYGVFHPQLRRGAAYTFGSSKNGSDYSSKNRQALSLQPVACAHLELSLVIGIRDLSATEGLEALLTGGRLAGGVICGIGTPCAYDDMEEALGSIRSGYVVMDRRDLLENAAGDNRAELFIKALGHRPVPGDGLGWLSAACLGYAAITPFEQRSGAREGYDHAFAEPLVGLVQYVPLRRCIDEGNAAQALWRPQWPASDVFRIYQKQS